MPVIAALYTAIPILYTAIPILYTVIPIPYIAIPILYTVIPILYTVIPAFYPRHSRESGNPDGCSQSSHMKPSINHSQRIPSPFKEEG